MEFYEEMCETCCSWACKSKDQYTGRCENPESNVDITNYEDWCEYWKSS
jgi:hypothetical protein